MLGSNSLTKAFDTLYIIKNIPEPYWQEYQISNFRKYRYYKFETDNKSAVNIAEFEFLGRSDRIHKQSKPTSLPIFSLNDQKILENSNFVKIEGIPLKAGPLFLELMTIILKHSWNLLIWEWTLQSQFVLPDSECYQGMQ